MDDCRPETAFEESGLDCLCIEVCRTLRTKVNILLRLIRFDADLKQLSLLSADNLHNLTADRRCKENVLRHLVCHYGSTREHLIALPYKEFRNKPPKVSRLDGNNVRGNHLSGVEGRRSFERNVQTLFQIDVV